MYPLHFYICLLASVFLVVSLVLLAVFPIKLPLVEAKRLDIKPKVRKARSPTPKKKKVVSYWDDWDDDEDDL